MHRATRERTRYEMTLDETDAKVGATQSQQLIKRPMAERMGRLDGLME